MSWTITRRDRAALAILALLLLGALGANIYRSGNIFYHATRYSRCRACGSVRKEGVLSIFGISLHESSQLRSTRLAQILQLTHGARCGLAGELPVANRELSCTRESFPWWRFSQRKYGDVAGLADSEGFQEGLSAVSRTNVEEARAIWSSLCRLDYRSSNVLARFYPQLASTNAASLVSLVHSEPVFELAPPAKMSRRAMDE